jgi:hypothetical protein
MRAGEAETQEEAEARRWEMWRALAPSCCPALPQSRAPVAAFKVGKEGLRLARPATLQGQTLCPKFQML